MLLKTLRMKKKQHLHLTLIHISNFEPNFELYYNIFMSSQLCSLIIQFFLQNYTIDEGERISFLLRVGIEIEIIVVDGISGTFFGNKNKVVVGECCCRIPRQRVFEGESCTQMAGKRSSMLWWCRIKVVGVITQTHLGGIHVHYGGIHCVCECFSIGSSQEKKNY